jgi:hypothetical protein
MLKEELKEIKKAKADLEEKLNEKDKDLLESNSAKVHQSPFECTN